MRTMMWIGKKKWDELWTHVIRTNHELGLVQRDVRWLKWLIGLVVAGVLTLVLKALVL